MLEKPSIPDSRILSQLKTGYDLDAARLSFLPLGADVNTAVYRVFTDTESTYFLKLRTGDFNEISVALPSFLRDQGIAPVLTPLKTRADSLSTSLDVYQLILYPYIEGLNGYEVALSDRQWREFGATLKAIHSLQVPSDLVKSIPRDRFSPVWREMVKSFQAVVEERSFEDHAAAQVAELMRLHRERISRLVNQAEDHARALRSRSIEFVLCHSDIHAGNLLLPFDQVSSPASLFMIDWDNPSFAPKEKDLNLIGGCSTWNEPHQKALFYQGYGSGEIDVQALAYYRCERIIQDIAAFCEQLLLSTAGGQDRDQSLIYFSSNFLPGHEIELAFNTGQD